MNNWPELTTKQRERLIELYVSSCGSEQRVVRANLVTKCRELYGFWIREEQLSDIMQQGEQRTMQKKIGDGL
jgi:hypothetical protein